VLSGFLFLLFLAEAVEAEVEVEVALCFCWPSLWLCCCCCRCWSWLLMVVSERRKSLAATLHSHFDTVLCAWHSNTHAYRHIIQIDKLFTKIKILDQTILMVAAH
jgi:hypothetical protein